MEGLDFLNALAGMEFSAYVAIAFLLYGIRQVFNFKKEYEALIAITLGLVWVTLEALGVPVHIILQGMFIGFTSFLLTKGIKFGEQKLTKNK